MAVTKQHAGKAVCPMPVCGSVLLFIVRAAVRAVSKCIASADAAGYQPDTDFHAARVVATHGLATGRDLPDLEKWAEVRQQCARVE